MTTYLLGMDGMDKQVIEDHIEKFPNLAKLNIQGLESITPPITVPAWACSFSGLDPDKVGSFDFQMPSEDYSFSPVSHRNFTSKGFWNHWNDKTALMDIPGAGAPELDGYSVGGFFHFGSLGTYPEELKEEMEQDLGKVEIKKMGQIDSEKKCRKEAYSIFETRKEVFEWLRKKDADVYFTVFRLPDTMMHHTDREKHLVEAYREVDEYVGKVMSEIEEEDNLLVFSDHGAVQADKRFFINTWLRENGFLRQKEEEENSLLDNLAYKVGDIGQRLGFRDLLVYLNNISQKTVEKDFAPRKGKALDSIDFESSKAFSYMTGVCAYSGIWVNDDRFEKGIVEDTEKVKEEIKDKLEERSEVRKVHRREELYETDPEMFPDLVVEFYEDHKVALGFHPEVVTEVTNYMHRKEGVLLSNLELEAGAELIDIAPTLLHLHDYPVPDGLDGKVLLDEEAKSQDRDVAGIDI